MKYLGKYSGKVYDNKYDAFECCLQIDDEQAKDEKFINEHHLKDLLDCVTCKGCPMKEMKK